MHHPDILSFYCELRSKSQVHLGTCPALGWQLTQEEAALQLPLHGCACARLALLGASAPVACGKGIFSTMTCICIYIYMYTLVLALLLALLYRGLSGSTLLADRA